MDQPGGTRHFELGEHLARSGHRLIVVTSKVTYQTRQKVDLGLLSPGEGIAVHRVWAFQARGAGFASRMLAFLSFMTSSFVKALPIRRVDVVWGTSPPIFQVLTTYLVAALKRTPFVLEVRDLWPDFAIHTGVLRSGLLIWLARRLELFLYRKADRIIVNSPGFISHLISRGVPKGQVELVPNGVDVAMFAGGDGDAVREAFGLRDKFIAVYAGAHGIANDLDSVLEAASLLKDYRDIAFVLVGDGTQRERLMREAETRGLTNVSFVPAQPKSRTPDFLAAADVCIAILKAVPMFDTTYPNKVFDYMAAGHPTVLAIDGAIREVVEKANGGFFVQPGNPQALALGILTYYQNSELKCRHGMNAQSYVKAYFDRPIQGEKLQRVFERSVRDHVRKGIVGSALKRLLDIVGSLVGLLILTIPFLLISLAIKLDSKGPVFFLDKRAGRKGWLFRPWKFRTMVHRAAETGLGYNVAKDDARITRAGRILRNWGLDELPQLINVVRGEMSLVGPRPTLPYQVEQYDEFQRRRLLVKPGITGWSLVHGRNRLTWQERIQYDVWYVDHWSLWIDIRVLIRTLWIVLITREGVYGEGGVNDDFQPKSPQKRGEGPSNVA